LGNVRNLVCLAAALVVFCPRSARAQKAPDFTLKDLSGQARTLSRSYPDKAVLLDFWATWCVPCVKELPHLQALQDRFGARGLQVLAVSIDGPDRLAAVAAFVGRYGYTMPVLLDARSEVIALYDPQLVLPLAVLVDRSGRIRFVHQGYSHGDERLIEAEIGKVLDEAGARKAAPVTSAGVNESFLMRLPSASSGIAEPGYSKVINQLDLRFTHGRFLAGARLDTNAAFSPFEAGFDLAKRYLQYAMPHLEARAGDFYTSLGRGLVFSLTKVFEGEGLDYVIDATVDGGRFAATAGPVSGEVFAGWVERPENHKTRDEVVGGTIGWKGSGLGTVRVQAIRADLQPGSAFGNLSVDSESVSVELPDLGGVAAVYVEFSLMRRKTYEGGDPIDGHGLYLGSKLQAGRFSLLLEMKDYRRLNFEYNRPPLLESEELEIVADQFDLDTTDITGYAARLDYYAPGSETLLFVKGLAIEDDPADHPLYGFYNRRIGHVLAGLEKKFAGGGYLSGVAGWRREDDSSIVFMSTNGRTLHDQINFSWPVGGSFSLEADWKHKVFEGPEYDYSEIRSALSLHRSPRWVLTGLYERSTDPAVVFANGHKNYWAGQLEVRLAGGHSLRLFVGSTKGSVKCAGGVCRLFPPFEGVRLEAFLWF
jgi:peroxiredoxin